MPLPEGFVLDAPEKQPRKDYSVPDGFVLEEPVAVAAPPKAGKKPDWYTGNINLFNRPAVKNEDGSISSIRSMSFQDDDGKEVLVPTVTDDGRIVSNEEAVRLYRETGRHLGKFDTPNDATKFANKLHDQQESLMEKPTPTKSYSVPPGFVLDEPVGAQAPVKDVSSGDDTDDIIDIPLRTGQIAREEGSGPGFIDKALTAGKILNTAYRESVLKKSELTKGLARGVHQTAGLIKGAGAVTADIAGLDKTRDYLLDSYLASMKDAQEYEGAVRNIQEIGDLGDFSDWAAGTLGEIAPTIATIMTTGGIGYVAAKKTVEGLIKQYAKKGAKEKAFKTAGKAALAEGVGAITGAATGSVGLETGSIYGEIFTETGEYHPWVAGGFGSVAGALDALPIIRILNKLGIGRQAKKEVLRDLAKQGYLKVITKEGAKQMAFEGGTEGVQTKIEQAALKFVQGKSMIETNPEEWQEIMNATAAGGLGGLVMGGGAGAAQVRAARETEQLPLDDGEDNVAAGTEAPPTKPPSPPTATETGTYVEISKDEPLDVDQEKLRK